MKLLNFLDNENFEMSEPVAIYDKNLTCPIFVGMVGNIPFSFLKNHVKSVEFESGSTEYKDQELFFTFKITLNI